jgi:Predicted integral membrane protein (DUF2275)/Putative zinc-finger
MNCEEVQKYLSDFLDENLDVERSQEIGDHLAACLLCSEEIASLAECQRLVSGLPTVEPPVGFTTRVMAHVRDAARKRSLWDRLFSPFQIKIPLQATAVVLIAVLAAYIYQKEPLQRESVISGQPESSFKKQAEIDNLAPSVTQAPSIASMTKEAAEETKPRVEEFKDSSQLKEPQSTPKAEEQNKGVAGSQPDAPATARAQNQVRSPATLSPTPLQEKPSAATEAASPRLEQSSSSGEAQAKGTPQSVPQSEKESASKDAAFARKTSEPVERSAASSLNPLSSSAIIDLAPPADHELAIRLKEPVRDDKNTGDRVVSGRTQIERRSMTLQEEARNLERAREQALQTGQSQTVWVTIAHNQYELFKKELAALENIEIESSTPELKNDAIAKSSERLRIKVTILPPLSSGNPTPSQPSSR